MGGGVCYSKISGGCFGNTPTSALILSNSKKFPEKFFIFFCHVIIFLYLCPCQTTTTVLKVGSDAAVN
jgi:hypothetical protein